MVDPRKSSFFVVRWKKVASLVGPTQFLAILVLRTR